MPENNKAPENDFCLDKVACALWSVLLPEVELVPFTPKNYSDPRIERVRQLQPVTQDGPVAMLNVRPEGLAISSLRDLRELLVDAYEQGAAMSQRHRRPVYPYFRV